MITQPVPLGHTAGTGFFYPSYRIFLAIANRSAVFHNEDRAFA